MSVPKHQRDIGCEQIGGGEGGGLVRDRGEGGGGGGVVQ